MTDAPATKSCQIHTVPQICEPIGLPDRVWQRRNRLRRILKRRYHFLCNLLFKGEPLAAKESAAERKVIAAKLQGGDLVRVRSRQEIEGTLNNWNQLRHCAFMEEMWIYCGTQHKVLKRVQRFLDERDYLMKKCNGIVLLEGVFCEGTKDFGPCDRTCHFFWREEWLEKVEV